ncbi:MAG TPA: hypothetical protein VFY06_12740, partial [Verrucomicrobiae bacterium]|nr:hypothetical protein [Verrucomicrobiae bacterium]
MKTSIISVAALMLCLGWAAGCAKKQSSIWESIKSPEIVTQLKSFVAQKEVQANAATNAPSPEVKAFFAAAGRGDWLAVSNAFMDFRNHAGQYERLPEASWQAVLETWGALDAFGEGNEKYSALFAKDIIQSIPPGSIYFGGTDPGQLLITAMQKDQAAGDPFFTIPPHELTDAAYLNYLRAMYGGKIHTPAAGDLQKCSEDYTNDVVRRLQTHQLKPGEQVAKDASGQVRISGYMATIEVRALMTKLVFDQNSNREFYVEESFPLDWMYPYEEPHGVIMKINRQPFAQLPDEIVQRDEDYWSKLIAPMIGDWLNKDTSLDDVTAFVKKVYVKKDLSGFTGDKDFL